MEDEQTNEAIDRTRQVNVPRWVHAVIQDRIRQLRHKQYAATGLPLEEIALRDKEYAKR